MRKTLSSTRDFAEVRARQLLLRELPQVLVDLIAGYAQHFKGLEVARGEKKDKSLFNASEQAWAMVQGKYEVVLISGELRTSVKTDTLIVALCLLSNKLVTAGADKSVRFWDAETGFCVSHFKGEACFWALTFADKEVAAGCQDGLVYLFSLATFQLTHKLKGHSRGVRAIARLTDGKLVSGAPRALLERDSEVKPRVGEGRGRALRRKRRVLRVERCAVGDHARNGRVH